MTAVFMTACFRSIMSVEESMNESPSVLEESPPVPVRAPLARKQTITRFSLSDS